MQYAKGQRVVVVPTASGVRDSFPVANWLNKPTAVTLLECCPKGTLDVVDVQLESGKSESIYAFNISGISI